MIQAISAFKTSDGRTFEKRHEAEAWERASRLAKAIVANSAPAETLTLSLEASVRQWLYENWQTIKNGVQHPLEERTIA
jgi:hypothetical protein